MGKKKKSALKMSQIQCQHLCITFVFGLVNLKKTRKKNKNFGHTFECSVHDTMLLQPFTSFCLRFFCQQGPLKTTNTEHTRKKVGTKQSENVANKRVIFHANAYFFFSLHELLRFTKKALNGWFPLVQPLVSFI